MKIKSIRNTGTSLTYPRGCYEVVIDFESPQSHPNNGLGDLGNCKTYQGIQNIRLPEMKTYTGVIAYFDGEPKLPVAA